MRHLCMLLATSLPLLSSAMRSTDDGAFVGWRGDSFDHQAVFGSRSDDTDTVTHSVSDADRSQEPWIETLSWAPRAFIYHHFLTNDEANALVEQAAPQMKRSTVVGQNTGEPSNVVNNIRTSYGTFLNRLSSPAVEGLERKLANWTQLPIVHQEDVQILRYETGQKYGSHYDALGRICTVLVYLAEPEEGGETAFPKTSIEDWAEPSQQSYETDLGFSECAQGHVSAKPRKGDALLFYSLKPDGKSTDSMAMHAGCPLIRGVKWTATIWMHPTPFRPDGFNDAFQVLKDTGDYSKVAGPPQNDPGICEDHDERCGTWEAAGECDKNPGFMRGEGSDQSGVCRKACHVCRVCRDNDRNCYRENREAAGYLDLSDEVQQLMHS